MASRGTYHAIMSFRSLLFCPDEKTARVVTQVLSELDFTVEPETESFAAVKRLSEEHFDALVVDCHNEQDASLLFKAARSSTQNSSSLSVAVVEGQAGVAKAFRIGANLVLTKPINVEQSKSTLRVARGLLKKTQPKPGAPLPTVRASEPPIPQKTANEFTPKPIAPPKPTFPPAVSAPAASSQGAIYKGSSPLLSESSRPTMPAASVPYSGLVLESEPEPTAQAEDLALLESLPQISGNRPAEPAAPAMLTHAGPIAASTSGQAAATALAPETKVLEFRTAGAAPMVTNEVIVSDMQRHDSESFAAPTFSSLESATGRSTGGSRFLKIALVLVILVGAGFFASQQPKVRDFLQDSLHRGNSAKVASAPGEASEPVSSSQPEASQPPVATAQTSQAARHAIAETAPSQAAKDRVQVESHTPAKKNAEAETIEVQELPIARDWGKTAVTPKPQAIVVKNDTVTEKPIQAAPPQVDTVADLGVAKMPDLAPSRVALPQPAPGTIRISQGVSQGLLLKKVQPAYPAIAKQMHKEGTVQLLATISKYGEVTKVQVLGGDPMLAKSAVDAVKGWEYRPYLLNGLPVEIETQISIVFKGSNY
jgi:TonB family protein